MSAAEKEQDRWPFINDWPMRRFLLLIISVVLAIVCYAAAIALVGNGTILDYFGYILVPFLLFVPGAMVLKCFRLHQLGLARSSFYALALSLLLIMTVGFVLNLLHLFGIMQSPLSFEMVTLMFPLVLVLLLFLAIKRDDTYEPPNVRHVINIETLLMIAFAILMPVVVIVAAIVAGFDGPRLPMRAIVFIVCLVPLSILSVRTKHYELLVFSLSLSLLFHRALMTDYISGYDIFSEYSAARITTANGWWDVSQSLGIYGGSANTALSIVTLAPMLTHLTSINTLMLMKIIYPFIFAFVPLGLYKVVEGQFDAKVAFVGVCLFMGYEAFFSLMVQLDKQMIAEVFLVGLLLALTDPYLSRKMKRTIILLFLTGILVSHYALAYLVMVMLIALVLFHVLKWIRLAWTKRRADSDPEPLHRWARSTIVGWWRGQREEQLITWDILLYGVAFFLIWFSLTASGIVLGYVGLGPPPASAVTGPTGITLSRIDALEYLLIDSGTPEKYLVLTTQILTVIGVVYLWRNRGAIGKVDENYLYLGLIASILLIACYVVPGFSASLYYGRMFTFSLIFLNGFLFIGIFGLTDVICKIKKGLWGSKRSLNIYKTAFTISVLIVTIFLLVNTKVLYTLSNDYVGSFSLDKTTSGSYYSDSDVVTVTWLTDPAHGASSPNADWHRFPIFGGQASSVENLRYQIDENQTDIMIFFSTWNMEYRYCYPLNVENSTHLTYCPINDVMAQVNGSYDVLYSSSGKSTVYYIPPNTTTETNPPGPPIYRYETTPLYYLAGVGVFLTSLVVLSWYVRRHGKGRP